MKKMSLLIAGTVGLALMLIVFQNFTLPDTTLYPMAFTQSASSDELTPGNSINAIDRDRTTFYSSKIFTGSTNNRSTYLAAWTDLNRPKVRVNAVSMKARMVNGIVRGFPQSYFIYVASPDNSSWIYVNRYTNQPDSTGRVMIKLDQTYTTNGIMIWPELLGKDANNNYYFQLAELNIKNFVPFSKKSILLAGTLVTIDNLSYAMQIDGNLAVYKDLGKPTQSVVWYSKTGPRDCNSGCQAEIGGQNGNFVLSKNGVPFYAGKLFHETNVVATAAAAGSANTRTSSTGVLPQFTLNAGQNITFGNLNLVMQTDGNFVLYQGSTVLWSTATQGRNCATNCYATLQADGNLALYQNGQWYWQAGVTGTANYFRIMATEPYVAVLNTSGILWAPGVISLAVLNQLELTYAKIKRAAIALAQTQNGGVFRPFKEGCYDLLDPARNAARDAAWNYPKSDQYARVVQTCITMISNTSH